MIVKLKSLMLVDKIALGGYSNLVSGHSNCGEIAYDSDMPNIVQATLRGKALLIPLSFVKFGVIDDGVPVVEPAQHSPAAYAHTAVDQPPPESVQADPEAPVSAPEAQPSDESGPAQDRPAEEPKRKPGRPRKA